jgi:hypothetical protein
MIPDSKQIPETFDSECKDQKRLSFPLPFKKSRQVTQGGRSGDEIPAMHCGCCWAAFFLRECVARENWGQDADVARSHKFFAD